MRSLLRLPLASPLALLGITLAALVGARLPLTGSPGPEAAQLLSAVGGPLLLFAGAARGGKRTESGFYGDLIAQGVVVLAALGIAMAVATVASWSVPSCAPGRGYQPFLVLALPVLALNSTIGLWLGRLLGNAKIAVLAALGALIGYGAWLAIDWFLEPSFRFLTHLLVLVEGDLIRGRAVSPMGVAYRFATLSFAGALALFGIARFPAQKRTGGISSGPSAHPAFLIGSALLAALAVFVHLQAASALAPSSGALRDEYSLEVRRDKLVLHADPSTVTAREAEALLAEGALWLHRIEQRMGAAPEEDVHIFVHRDQRTMGRWTGAEHVHFALPSHNEIHVTGTQVPHPTLGHELVHVLGQRLAGGMLGVPTRLGVLPNTGMIEGLAMAMTPELEVHDGLTLREKAAAMRQADLAPPVEELFGGYLTFFRFWRHPPGNAYVTAGALVESVAAVAGKDGLATMYREGDLEAAFGDEGAMLAFLHEHDESLRTAELPPDAIPTVTQRYSRPSILDETCDPDRRETARLIREAARGGNFEDAESLARAAEGGTIAGKTLAALARAAGELRDDERATSYMLARAEAGDAASARERNVRREDAGDALWVAGQRRAALATWRRVDETVLPPWRQRYLTAKLLLGAAARARPDDSELAFAGLKLLLANDKTDPVVLIAHIAEELGRASVGKVRESERVLAFSRYLLMRQYLQRGDTTRGLAMALDLYRDRELLHETFREQVLRGVALGHARRGDLELAASGYELIAEQTARSADRVLLRDRAERARRMLKARSDDDGERRGDRWLLGLDVAGGL